MSVLDRGWLHRDSRKRIERICEECELKFTVREGEVHTTCPPCDYEAYRLKQAAG